MTRLGFPDRRGVKRSRAGTNLGARDRSPPAEAGRLLVRADGWQRRHAVPGFVVALVRKYLDDGASRLATLVTYYAFVSVFPLLLAFTSILGFVLQGDESLQDEILDSALARLPVIGAQLRNQVDPLTGSGVALVIGLAVALWAGLGVTIALDRAFEAIWDVPRLERRGMVAVRGRGAVVLLVFAVAIVASTVVTGLAVEGPGPAAVHRVGILVGSLALNAAVFLVLFRVLNVRPLSVRELAPGVALAAVGSLALKSAGAWYVDHAVARASDTYGAFAIVIGFLSWFWLGSNLLLLAAEVDVVLHRRLWPRSLTGDLEPADRRALREAAEAARQDPRQEIVVRFSDEPDERSP
jgi:membrane protein